MTSPPMSPSNVPDKVSKLGKIVSPTAVDVNESSFGSSFKQPTDIQETIDLSSLQGTFS